MINAQQTTDYTQARKNMVDCQIATMGITEQSLLDALMDVPREQFLPPEKRCAAYSDTDLPLGHNSFLLEPLVFARMVQAARLLPTDSVLNLGDASGYSAAVLSRFVAKVYSPSAVPGAAAVWSDLGAKNIISTGELPGTYDVIFINGSVAAIPQDLAGQLNDGGRLLAVQRDAGKPGGKIIIVTKMANGHLGCTSLYDAAPPYVAGFEPKAGFSF